MKLPKEDLASFHEANSANEKAKTNLAYAVMDEASIAAKKNRSITEFHAAQQKLKAETIKITQKYGEGVRIDLATGNIIEPNGAD